MCAFHVVVLIACWREAAILGYAIQSAREDRAAPAHSGDDVVSVATILFLLLTVVVSSSLARSTTLPLPLVQIALGALIALSAVPTVELDPQLFFLLFLPPLLFLAGWRIPTEGLVRDRAVVLELALGLVLLTVVGIGFLINWLIPAVPLPVAFALAAVVAPCGWPVCAPSGPSCTGYPAIGNTTANPHANSFVKSTCSRRDTPGSVV